MSGSAAAPAGHQVTLVGKPGCHLCDDARPIVMAACEQSGADFVEVSVLDDPELMDRYGEFIPVVLIDGEQHDFFQVSAQRLLAALRR